MPRKQNRKNLRTEKEGIKILKKEFKEKLLVPSKKQKKTLYGFLNIDFGQYSKSIDAVILHVDSFEEVKNKKDFMLIEIKTTRAEHVTELPFGAFFGITENEEDLFRSVDNYRLCIVHTGLKEYKLLEFDEYKSLIQNKRIQYQVKFRQNP